MTNNRFGMPIPLPLALLVGAALHAPAWAGPAATPAPDATHAADATVPATTGSSPNELEEIQVTGVRASLEKSIEMKRDAEVALDSINALEMGRFPDADVADSLSHLPGVTISRTTGGEGLRVNVQGLGPQYNLVTINDRILATDDDGRALAFDVLPSEVISGADVIKSSEASALEGSIGGTVNLRTASPFDNPGLHGGVHAEGGYNDMSHLKGQKYSAFLSDTNASGTFGIMATLTHSQVDTRTDSLNNNNQATWGVLQYPFTGTGPGVQTLSSTPCCIAFGSIFDNKKRDAVSGSIEWRPTSTLKVALDGLFTRLNDPQYGYNQSYYFPSSTDGTPWSNPIIQNGVVTGVTSSYFQPEIVNNTVNRKADTSEFGLNVAWEPTDRLSFTGDLYQSRASRPEGGKDFYATAGLVSNTTSAQDTLIFNDQPNSLPNINVLIPPSQLGLSACPAGTAGLNGQCSYTALLNSGALNDNKYWSTHWAPMNGYDVQDLVTGLNLKGAWKADLGVLKKIEFGLGANRRGKQRTDISNEWTGGAGQYSLYNTFGCDVQCTPTSFGSQGYNVISFANVPNFMQGAGGSYPTALPILNTSQLLSFFQSLNGKQNPYFCTPPASGPSSVAANCPPGTQYNFANYLPQVNRANSYSVTEKTVSLFGQLDFAGENWSGNLGLRVVHTQTVATTAPNVPTAVWTPDLVGTTRTYTVIYSDALTQESRSSYTLPLPSLNVSYWAVPETVQLRFAAAQTMSRPNLNLLAPTATNSAAGGYAYFNYTGTSGLKPIKSTQANFSAEWYYAPHAALTFAVFGKKLKDDIYYPQSLNVDLGTKLYVGGPPGTVPAQPFLWTVSAPTNSASSHFYGGELAWQQILDNGLGAHLQYTHTWSNSVNQTPPETLSAGLLYEKGPISLDVNWDYQSSYRSACSTCTEVYGWPVISSPFQWLTASAHYKFGQGFDVYVEGKNLTNSVARSYLNGNPLLPWANGQAVGQSASGVGEGYTAYGRFYTLGAAYRF